MFGVGVFGVPVAVAPESVIFQPSPSGAKPTFSIHMGSYQLNGT